MNVMIDRQPWDELLDGLKEKDTVSALHILTALEQANEEETEQFFDDLAEKQISVDLTTLPKTPISGTSAARLRQEESIAGPDQLLQNLEENDPLRLYLEELAAIPATELPVNPTTPQERQRFVDGMLGVAVSLAQEHVGMGVLLLDLIQEANLGVWQGVQDYTSGDMTQHCIWWSRHYLARTVLMQAKNSGVGQKLRQATSDYRAVDEKLLAELGRNPTTEEIAEALHMSVSETETVAEMLEVAKLLNRFKAPEQETIPQDEDQAVEDTAYFQMRQRIQELLSALSPEEAKLLSLRYGLEGGIPMKPEQVAKELGITAEEVTTREAAALSRLRTGN